MVKYTKYYVNDNIEENEFSSRIIIYDSILKKHLLIFIYELLSYIWKVLIQVFKTFLFNIMLINIFLYNLFFPFIKKFKDQNNKKIFLPSYDIKNLTKFGKDWLNSGNFVDATNEDGNTLLMLSIIKKDFASAQFLINHGADPNRQNKQGCTSMHYAAELGNEDLITLLHKNGGRFDIENYNGVKPQDLLIENKNITNDFWNLLQKSITIIDNGYIIYDTLTKAYLLWSGVPILITTGGFILNKICKNMLK
ncbi:ankyrin [Anaeromyces robustus]|uniref:Ankyrin n=1 Tax=Anaeromyces robustus TaxID=1754192 RepID=A0A1Y1XPB2_9FUNG|nr:ankyrin [Anaeromyces robustus]|eukprot:ORX87571.1 ankyrin [Anaeromyces robustus]